MAAKKLARGQGPDFCASSSMRRRLELAIVPGSRCAPHDRLAPPGIDERAGHSPISPRGLVLKKSAGRTWDYRAIYDVWTARRADYRQGRTIPPVLPAPMDRRP